MISFTCTCGKTYQLPDRHAGREVRCNQCGKTLVVPKESQTEPVVPLGETELEKQATATPGTAVETKKSSPLVPLAVGVVALVVGILIGKMLPSTPPPEVHGKLGPVANTELFGEPKTPVDDDQGTDDHVSAPFAVKTIDGASIRFSSDGDPVKAQQGENVLDVLADAVKTEDEKAKDDQKHEQSFRIDSASREELRIIWPGDGKSSPSGITDGDKIKEFQFSLYVPDKPNSAFKPGKPEGIDKILVLSSIRLRLVADNGIIEYGPADREHFVQIMDRCRSGWLPIRIPIQGDETWKRTDFGLAGPLVVDRIELRAKPTGSGVTFWIDNLAVVE